MQPKNSERLLIFTLITIGGFPCNLNFGLHRTIFSEAMAFICCCELSHLKCRLQVNTDYWIQINILLCEYVFLYFVIYVCACKCESERNGGGEGERVKEREKEKEEKDRDRESVCVCLSVWELDLNILTIVHNFVTDWICHKRGRQTHQVYKYVEQVFWKRSS